MEAGDAEARDPTPARKGLPGCPPRARRLLVESVRLAPECLPSNTADRNPWHSGQCACGRLTNGKTVLITGGLGFIGSNLAHRLAAERSVNPDRRFADPASGGANLVQPRRLVSAGSPRSIILDSPDSAVCAAVYDGVDVIFNLAGQVSHIDSMQDPFTDLEINCRSQLALLECCRHNAIRRPRSSLPARARSTAAYRRRPAGRRTAAARPDRRQRHQQARRRALPRALQQRLWHPHQRAAADQYVRPAHAGQEQSSDGASAGSSARRWTTRTSPSSATAAIARLHLRRRAWSRPS